MTLRLIFATWRCIISASAFWLSLLTFSAFTLPFQLFRCLLNVFVGSKYSSTWGKLLDSADSFLHEDFETCDSLSCVLLLGAVCEGDPNLLKFQRFFNDHVLKYKTFRGEEPYEKFLWRQESWLGYSIWRPARHFDIDDHVRFLPDFHLRDFVTKEELETFLGEYQSKSFGRRPPWELLLVDNYVETEDELENNVPPSKFVLLLRWHHSLGDVVSMAKIFTEVLGGETSRSNFEDFSGGRLRDPPRINWPQEQDSWISTGWSVAKQQLHNLVQVGQEAVAFLLTSDRSVWRVSEDMLTGVNHLVSTKKLPLNVARLVAKKQDVQVSSVMYTAVAGGIRQYFIETGQARRLPKEMRMRVSLPFNKKAGRGLHNFWTVGNIALPVGESTPLKRLHNVQESRKQLQRSWLPSLLYVIKVLQSALPNFFSRYNFQDRGPTINGINFPGPSEQVLLLGEYPALEFFSFHPRLLSDAAISLSILSYYGSIRFFLSVEKTLFPSRSAAVKLAKLIEQEFMELQRMYEVSGESID